MTQPPRHAHSPTQNRPSQSDAAKQERAKLLSAIHATLTSDPGKQFLTWLHAAAPIDCPLNDADHFDSTFDPAVFLALFTTVPGRTTLAWLCHIGGTDRPVYQLLPANAHLDPLAACVREGRRLIPAMLRSLVNGTYHPGIPGDTLAATKDGLRQLHLEILSTLADAKAEHSILGPE
jgi:hypothetical protein